MDYRVENTELIKRLSALIFLKEILDNPEIPLQINYDIRNWLTVTITKNDVLLGHQNGIFITLLPKELIGDQQLYKELIDPKPKGFNPNALYLSMSYIKHLKVCHDNNICIQCGRQDFNYETCLPMYPYCSIHDPCGKYYQGLFSSDLGVTSPIDNCTASA